MQQGNRVAKGLFWKLLERFGVQAGHFVLQLVLARILSPEHYGTLSVMVVFTSLAQIFIQGGFNTALVQNKDVTEEDYSSVFWITLGVATILYIVLFWAAPWIGMFYEMPEIVNPLRVLGLILLPGALNSVQLAIVNRALDYKKVFYSNVAAIVVAGVAGIMMAVAGAGVWALVVQNLLNTSVACVVMWFTVKFRPKFICNWQRVEKLFSFGWKILASGLLDTLFQNLNSLVIGKKYAADTLGYYNRGQQFPNFIIVSINHAVQNVLLSAMSAEQSDHSKVKGMARTSVMLSSYIIFPIMCGLASVATPLVTILLTEKWLPCVPYLQICCFAFAFYPIHSSNLQAINAVGRSDIFLLLEMIKKSINIAILVIALICLDSPIAIALSSLISSFISSFVNAFPNKKLIGYSFAEQVKDVLPSMLAALVMFGCVESLAGLDLNVFVMLILQIVVGVVLYVAISAILRLEPFMLILGMLKKLNKKGKTR